MAVPDEHERTLAFAEVALQQIKALRQPASPRHFQIWYQYATGYTPELNRSINELLGHCLDGCGIQADIIVGEDRDSYFVQGRLKNHRGPAGRAEGNP